MKRSRWVGSVQTPTFESLQKKTQNKTNNTKNVQDSQQLWVLSNYLGITLSFLRWDQEKFIDSKYYIISIISLWWT